MRKRPGLEPRARPSIRRCTAHRERPPGAGPLGPLHRLVRESVARLSAGLGHDHPVSMETRATAARLSRARRSHRVAMRLPCDAGDRTIRVSGAAPRRVGAVPAPLPASLDEGRPGAPATRTTRGEFPLRGRGAGAGRVAGARPEAVSRSAYLTALTVVTQIITKRTTPTRLRVVNMVASQGRLRAAMSMTQADLICLGCELKN